MKPIVFMHSALPPEAFADALRRSIDPERWTLFSLSGYKGDRAMLGEVGSSAFRLQKRRYSRNDFAGHFYGTFRPANGGTRIEGYFSPPLWARIWMRVWAAGTVVIGVPLFVLTLQDLVTGKSTLHGDTSLGLLIPVLFWFIAFGIPRITRRFGRGDRKFMIEFVEQVAAAKADDLEMSSR